MRAMMALFSTPDLKMVAGRPRPALAAIPEMWRRALSVPRVLRLKRATQVGTTPHDVVLTRGHFKLLRYKRATPATYAEPMLFCYALVNRPYILDLQPDKSVVRRYLEQGFDVYMIDWGVPADQDYHLTLERYVCDFLSSAVAHVLKASRSTRLHLLGYCMGGTLATMFTALHPELVKSITLLASPIDFSGRETLLSVWSSADTFDVDAFIDAHGNCPARFLQRCFQYIKPVQNLLEKKLGFVEHMTDNTFVINYFALEKWVNDNIPVAGETFREFVKKLYQQNQLVRGEFQLGAKRIDLRRIECPLLLLTAKNDHLVAPASTEGIRACVSSKDIESLNSDCGHVGLVVSGKARKTVWPTATRWLASRSTHTTSSAAHTLSEHNV
ncbi:MAG: Poly-beta-hydroxybutyrate polymerase [Pseudomonadota bacterium]